MTSRTRRPALALPAAALAAVFAAALVSPPAAAQPAVQDPPASAAAQPAAPAAGDAAATADPTPAHAATRELLSLVHDAAALVAAEGVEGACADFRTPGSRWLHDETYVFVIDTQGEALCHPGQPALEGRSLLELHDPHGKPIVASFLRELENDKDGWVHYLWPRPGRDTTFYWKSSFVEKTPTPGGATVLVGSGVYGLPMERLFVVEQVDDAVELLAAQGEAAFATLRDRSSGFRFYDSYVFVMSPEGVQVVNAGFPDVEGQNLLDLADEDGTVIGREILALLADREAGWVDYKWPRPGDEKAVGKSTYVRRVTLPDGRELIVGAGIYD